MGAATLPPILAKDYCITTGYASPMQTSSSSSSSIATSTTSRRPKSVTIPRFTTTLHLSSRFSTPAASKQNLRRRSHTIRSAAATATTDTDPINPSAAPTKFLGVEILTLKKVIPLGLMFFCILFNYTALRNTKDVLVVTAKGSSAEIIPFLKTWVNLPMAIAFMILYHKLSNVLSKEMLFYACILPFLAFFGAFAFVLYPLVDVLHPAAMADSLLGLLGPRFLGPIAILRNWTFVLFYVMAELWGSVVVSLLFWGFANQVVLSNTSQNFEENLAQV